MTRNITLGLIKKTKAAIPRKNAISVWGIQRKTGSNWRSIEAALEHLKKEGIVEKIETTTKKFWRRVR